MAKGIEHDWPDDETLVAECGQYPSINAAAGARGITDVVLRNALKRKGLFEEVKARQAAVKRATKRTPRVGEQVSREEILEQELAEAREQLQKARSDEVKAERVIQTLAEHLPAKTPRYKPAKISRPGKRAAHTLVLCWSDTHAAEVVSAEEVNGANAYSWQIMLDRHDELRRGVLSWAERFGPVEELVILGLGDMLSGNIHDELAETNEMPLAEATVQFGLDGAEFIESFVEHFPRIRFSGVVGNHPRPTRKPRAKHRFDNADWTCYQIMAQRLARHPSITFDVPKAQTHPVEIYDRRILCQHGDGVRSSMVGVPWGGIVRHEARLRNQYAAQGIPFDHLAIGHYHEANVVSNRRIWVNGSVKGLDEYSLQAFGGGQPPTQLLIPFHPRWGMVGAQYIDLEPGA